ncbi:MAG: HlyD family secretion protein [Rhodospirillaceae bacterium]|nr:HlyD family secretion protein [Rhodospirillaceae bacterium]
MDGSPTEKVATIDYQTAASPRRRAWRVLRTVFLGLAVIGGLLLLADWAYKRYTNVYIDDARITADVISVSSRVSGWVTKLHVSEGDRVKAGATLVSIDIRDAKLQLTELDSRLQAIGAERSRALTEKTMIDRQTKSAQSVRRSQVRAAKAALAGRRSDLDLARTDFERTKKLLNRKVVSRQRWEERRNAFRKAEQAFQQAQAEVAAATASLIQAAADREQLLVLDRQLTMLTHREAEVSAQRERQLLNLSDRLITSPVDGVVDKTFVNPSEFVSAGQRLLMVHDPKKIWVSANVKETDLRHIKIGSAVTVEVDAYPDQVFEGKISKIGNAATSEFALLPTPNPSGNFTKVVQRIRIRVNLENKDELLRPGMMVEVNVGIDDR